MNTNKIKNQLMRVKQSLIALFFLLTLSLNFACVDSPDNMQVISDNPFGVGIIVFNSVPSQIFGNGCEIDTIKLNTGLIADGSTIDVIVTNTGSLESEAGGCVVGSSATVVNDMATFDFLSPILIGNAGESAVVNVGVTITTPDGTEINDFFQALVNAVGITSPDDFAATPNDTDAPTSLFFNLEFTTFGIKPGTEVMCDVSNGDLGAVTTNSVVSGNLQAGSFNVEYTLANGSAGGTQILTCMVELPNPSSFGPQCASVPLEDRKINAEVVITQNAAGDIANPPPDPAPTSMVCNPSTIQEGNSGTCTCVNSNAAGEEICFNGDTDISFPDTCSTADVDGVAIVLYDAGLIPDESSINTVSCGPSGGDGSLDPGDPFAQTNITVTQETPVVAGNLSCTPNPAIAGDELVCTCTSNAEPGSELCFENTEMMTSVVSFPGAPDNCVVADGNGNGVVIADATATLVPINNILQCCVNSNMDSDCDEETVAQLVQLVNPVTVGDITVDVVANPSLVNFLGQSILTGTISGLPPGTQGCFDVFIEGSGITNGGGTTDPVINGVTTPVCATTDANGDIIVIYTAGDAEGIDTIRFCHDADTSDTCDAGETADLVQITVEAAAPPPPAMVECTSNPGTVIPGNDSSINASFANLPAGFDFACFQFLSQTSPESTLTSPSEANQTDAVCVPINNDIAAAVFTANAGIIAPQNAFVSCCAGTMGGAGDDCTQAGALLGLPALVTVDPAPVSPFTISIGSTSGVTTTMAGDSEGLDLATNPPVPSGTQLCVELTFEDMAGVAMITSTTDGDSPVPEGGTLCATTVGIGGAILSNFGFDTPGGAGVGEIATMTGCIDLNANDTCDPGDPFNTFTFTVVP